MMTNIFHGNFAWNSHGIWLGTLIISCIASKPFPCLLFSSLPQEFLYRRLAGVPVRSLDAASGAGCWSCGTPTLWSRAAAVPSLTTCWRDTTALAMAQGYVEDNVPVGLSFTVNRAAPGFVYWLHHRKSRLSSISGGDLFMLMNLDRTL